MILMSCGQVSQKHFDALLLFALQLDQRGHRVAIDPRFVPEGLSKQSKFEVAPFLTDCDDIVPDCLVVIGADAVSDDIQAILGSLQFDSSVPIWITGHFAVLQDEISARNKVAYATGQEPQVLNLANHQYSAVADNTMTPLLTVIGDAPEQSAGQAMRVFVYVPHDEIEDNIAAIQQYSVFNFSPNTKLHLLTNAKGKALIRESRYSDLSVFSYSELPPTELLHYFDVLVFLGPKIPGERMAALALNAMGAGKVVIDCTESAAFSQAGAPMLKGPPDAAALPGYLLDTVALNRHEIGHRTQRSDWLRPFDLAQLETQIGLSAPADTAKERPHQTLFVPTNGNGLGHAQRCALIAEEMADDDALSFAAFPSCVDMLRNRGLPCTPLVQRSAEHIEEYAADLLNYLRLRNIVKTGDQIVFDGGYVFDSVYRLISQSKSPAIWIRRGLWRPGQINPVALERERAFRKVIVPVEAFAELNVDYSAGDTIHKVGPIVRQCRISAKEKTCLRSKLSVQFARPVTTLVVTMLGGGVASDRSAQTQLLCNMLERRPETLHLVVAWPQAFVPNALYGWQNTEVIHTSRIAELAQSADLCVSAAGYNSFHELIYAQVPTIFIPQAATYLDDQTRRASAAHERGLAGFVEESELLKLEQEVSAFLDTDKTDAVRQNLRAESLPETGNQAAARLISEGWKR